MAKPDWHEHLPWTRLKKWYAYGRRRWFSAHRPVGEYYRVDVTIDELERRLGRQGFTPNDLWSYYKKGEDLNVASDFYREFDEHDPVWWQDHIRAWEVDGIVDVGAHFEPAPEPHPDAHLAGVGFNRPWGMDRLQEDLDDVGVGFEVVEWPG